jgi:glycosyltransferase involved in cell wall biosynthesis
MKPTIAVYTICKDEEANVAAFLDTVHEADAIYVADTGSTDGTFAQFSRWYSLHPWSRNKIHLQSISVAPFRFDVARNTALALVPPSVDVCVVLDLDEDLTPSWKQAILDRWHGDTNAIRPWYVNGDGYQTFDGRRIHSRAGWVWRHACHEQLYPWGGVANFVDAQEIVITHKRVMLHRSYLDLCYTAWREDPTDAHCQFFLAREYYVCGMYEMAVELLTHYLEREVTEKEEHRMAQVFLGWAQGELEARASGLMKGQRALRDSGLVVPA